VQDIDQMLDQAVDAWRDGRWQTFAELTELVREIGQMSIDKIKAELRARGVDLDAQPALT